MQYEGIQLQRLTVNKGDRHSERERAVWRSTSSDTNVFIGKNISSLNDLDLDFYKKLWVHVPWYTVNSVLSDTYVISFPVFSDVEFQAILTILYVFYSLKINTLCIPTQNISLS